MHSRHGHRGGRVIELKVRVHKRKDKAADSVIGFTAEKGNTTDVTNKERRVTDTILFVCCCFTP